MGKLLPLILAVLGLSAGAGAGYLLRPPPEDKVETNPCGDIQPEEAKHSGPAPGHDDSEATAPSHEYVKMNNQFVVPVVEAGNVSALVILSINLEVSPGATEQIYAREPKLRDGFLQVLFDHANAGGFQGAFTQSSNLDVLRHALLETAQKAMGALVSDVLIVDIVRQDS